MNRYDLEGYLLLGLMVTVIPLALIITSPLIVPLMFIGWCAHKLGLRA